MKTILSISFLMLMYVAHSQSVLYDQAGPSAPGYIYANEFTDIDTYIKVADDFTVPAGEVWTISQVELQIYSPSYTVPDSTLVEIFDNSNGYPETVVYSDVLQFDACTFIGSGIAWPTISIASPALPEGNYWISLTGYTIEANIWTWNLVTGNHGSEGVYVDPEGYGGPVYSDWVTFSDAGVDGTGLNFILSGNKEMASITPFKDEEIQIYPNPANSTCTITLSDEVTFFEVLDVKGSLIQTTSKSASNQYDFSALEPGVYFIQWREKGETHQQKLVKS